MIMRGSGFKLFLAGALAALFSACASAPTPLIKASMEGNAAEVGNLLGKKEDVNGTGTVPNLNYPNTAPRYFIDSTPLMGAAHAGNNEMVALLLDRGAALEAKNFMNMTALHMASCRGMTGAVKLLIKRGANVNPHDPADGWSYILSTPLICAARDGHLATVKVLVAAGAEINAKTYNSYTALHYAAAHGHLETVKYLVGHGADATIKADGNPGPTALDEARKSEHADIVRFLEESAAGKVVVLRLKAAPPEDPAQEAAFRKEAEAYRAHETKPELPEEARKYKAQAEFAFEEKRFEDATRYYARALEIAPWWPDGHFNRALILAELYGYEEAIREMRKYLLLAPDAPDARAAQDKIYQWESRLE